MRRAARRHLLDRLEASLAPCFVFLPARQTTHEEAIAMVRDLLLGPQLSQLLVLQRDADLRVISPKVSGVRSVAGKGSRRRGLRCPAPPPLLVLRKPSPGSTARYLAGSASMLARRDAQLDREHRTELTQDPGGRRRRVVA